MSSTQTNGPARPLRPVAVIVGVLILADVVSSFESAMMLLAIPRLMAAFQASAADVSWVITAFLLVASASAAICGRLGDIFGRRRLLVILLLISAAGSVVSIASGSLAGVIVGRAIQGVAGGILPLCFGLAREHLPRKKVPTAISLVAATAMLAAAAANLISGVLIDLLDWHWVFVFAAVVAAIAAATCALLPRSAIVATVQRIDGVGAVLFAVAVALVLLGITKSATWTWAAPRTPATIVAGVALLAVWAWWELRHPSPMINIRIFLGRRLALTIVATAALAIGTQGAMGIVLPIIYQTPSAAPVGLGLTATQTGTIAFGVTIVGFLIAPLSGRIAARAGSRVSVVIGTVLGLAATAALALLYHTVPGMIASAVVFMLSTSFILTGLPNLIVEVVPPENTSETTGIYTVARSAFTGVGTVLATLLLSLSVVPGTRFSTQGAFHSVFVLVGASCAAGLLVALLVRPIRRAVTASPAEAALAPEGQSPDR